MAAIADDYSYSTRGAITYGPKSARLCDLTSFREDLVRLLSHARQRQHSATGAHTRIYAQMVSHYEHEIITVSLTIQQRKAANRRANERRKEKRAQTVAPALAVAG
jgi:hypothetical protein